MIIYNFIALGELTVAFWSAALVGWLMGRTDWEAVAAMASPLLIVCDLLYRRRRSLLNDAWWYHHRSGGQMFFLPVWTIGIWLLLTVAWDALSKL